MNETNKIKIHGYFLCWNEEYILPHLLKHYYFCDQIFILDNYSNDKTYEIIKNFKHNLNYNIRVLAFNTNNEYRDDIFLNLANNIWKEYSRGKCDYVIFGDADEFICHKDIVTFLNDKHKLGYSILITKGYHMVGDVDLELKFDDNILEKVDKGFYVSQLNKPMVFDPNKIKEINFCVGRHFCNPVGDVKIYYANDDFILKHFKFLGLNNYLLKVENYQKRFSDINKKMNWATYWLESKDEHIKIYNDFVSKREEIKL